MVKFICLKGKTMATNKNYGYWKDRKVLFIGDSLTAARLYPETPYPEMAKCAVCRNDSETSVRHHID